MEQVMVYAVDLNFVESNGGVGWGESEVSIPPSSPRNPPPQPNSYMYHFVEKFLSLELDLSSMLQITFWV